jgi:hypothetical protein
MSGVVPALIAKLFQLPDHKRTHPIRVIIDATSTADLKTRSHRTLADQILLRLVLIFKTSELVLPIIFDLSHKTLWKWNVV